MYFSWKMLEESYEMYVFWLGDFEKGFVLGRYWGFAMDWILLWIKDNSETEYFNPSYSEKAMAPHSSTLAWRIPWMEEPGGLQSIGLLRVRYDWVTSLSLFTFMHWRRKWQPSPVFLPGESQGWGCLVGCCLWGCKESDTTEATQQQQQPWLSG